VSYLSRRVREIKEEEYYREHPVYDFVHDELILPNRRVPVEPDLSPVNWRGRAG
jgi:hypothetical protein